MGTITIYSTDFREEVDLLRPGTWKRLWVEGAHGDFIFVHQGVLIEDSFAVPGSADAVGSDAWRAQLEGELEELDSGVFRYAGVEYRIEWARSAQEPNRQRHAKPGRAAETGD